MCFSTEWTFVVHQGVDFFVLLWYIAVDFRRLICQYGRTFFIPGVLKHKVFLRMTSLITNTDYFPEHRSIESQIDETRCLRFQTI